MPLDRLSGRNHRARTLRYRAGAFARSRRASTRSNRPPASMATASAWAGTATIPSPACTARSGRPGRTTICATFAGTCSRICSSPMYAPRPARRSPGRTVIRFAAGKWMFMHNGFIGSWSRLRRRVEAMIPDTLYPSRIGTTDSEAIFLAIMGAGIDHPVAAAESVLARIGDLVDETESGRPLPLHGRADQRPRSVRLPLCGERQGQYALLPGIGPRHRHRFRAV